MRKLLLTDAVLITGTIKAGTILDETMVDEDLLEQLALQGIPVIDYVETMETVRQGFLNQTRVQGRGGYPGLAESLAATGQLTGTNTVGPPNIYLDPSAGSDSNSGLTPAAPLRTWDAVKQLIPRSLSTPVVVHIAAGATTPPEFEVTTFGRGMVVMRCDGAGQPGQDGHIEIATGTTSAPSTETFTLETGLPLTKNQWRGLNVTLTSGPHAGRIRNVVRNDTSGRLYFAAGFDGTNQPDGISFRVTKPSFRFLRTTTFESRVGVNGVFGLVNIQCGDFQRLSFENCTVFALGMMMDDQSFYGTIECSRGSLLLMTTDRPPGGSQEIVTAFREAMGISFFDWRGWGVSAFDENVASFSWPGIQVDGSSWFFGYYIGPYLATGLSNPGVLCGGAITSTGSGTGTGINASNVAVDVTFYCYFQFGDDSSMQIRGGSHFSIALTHPTGLAEMISDGADLIQLTESRLTVFSPLNNGRFRAVVDNGRFIGAFNGSEFSITGASVDVDGRPSAPTVPWLQVDGRSSGVIAGRVGKSLYAGPVRVTNNSQLTMEGDWELTNVGSNLSPLEINTLARVTQGLSATVECTTSVATRPCIEAFGGSRADFVGGSQTIMNGGSERAVVVRGDSHFNAQSGFANFFGPAGAELQIDNTPLDKADFVALGAQATGGTIASSPGTGGGSRIGRG